MLEIGKARVINETLSDLVIFSFGNMLDLSMEIADQINCSLMDMRFIKPLDEELIKKSETLEKLSSPRDIVFGHNDFLAANFLDDGSNLGSRLGIWWI